MIPANITIESHVSGDTWQGIAVIGPVLNGVDPMPVAAASARLRFATSGSSDTPLVLGTEGTVDAPITLVDGAGWEFTIPPVTPDIWTPVPGTYYGHFEVTDTAGTVLTIYKIELPVLEDFTP